MNGRVVVDASLVVKWLVWEPDSGSARALARTWAGDGVTPTAPYLMPVEVSNALHRRVLRGELTVADAARLLEAMLTSGVELLATPRLHSRALELAGLLGQGAVYDSHYLALAETLDCDLWTADERFWRAASRSARVHWIGEPDLPDRA